MSDLTTKPVCVEVPSVRYRDADWLREQYVKQRRGTPDIADECGVTTNTICEWLRRHGIETRSRSERRRMAGSNSVPVYADNGYERWTAWDPERQSPVHVSVHRLAAVAWFGLDAVAGRDVHHENRIPWDNRETNLRCVSSEDHMREHRKQEPPERGDDGRFR